MKQKEDNRVGEQIGIYKILELCDKKSNDGHKVYRVKCSVCDWETFIQYRHIFYLNPNCNHLNSAQKYKVQKINIENKRIKRIYHGMVDRCYNFNNKSYRFYGGKGVKIYEEWLNNPKLFEDWSLNNGYRDGLTIDRIDPNKNYSPENCRWVTLLDNSKYKSTTKITTVDGISHTGKEWADVLELGTNTINKMLREYPEDKVKEFISKRMKDKTICRHSHETWMKAYGL